MAIAIQPDGGAVVTLGEYQNVSKRAVLEIVNLVPVVANSSKSFPSINNDKQMVNGEEILREIGDIVCSDFEVDIVSREVWATGTSNILKLFSAFAEPKTFPWDKCSNIKLPVITISAIQFQARAFEAMFPPEGAVRVVPTGDEDVKRASRVQEYMNWQTLYQMKEFVPGMDKTLMQSPLIGSTFKKTFYSFEKKRVVSQCVSALDMVYPYSMSDFETSPRKTHILYMTKNDIRKRVKSGVFIPKAWDATPGVIDLSNVDLKQTKDDVQGIRSPGEYRYDSPRIILEQHRDWDLDGDGIAEPYVVTVDYETRQPWRITSRSFTNAFGQNIEIEYFTDYCFLPNPEGAYAYGLGTLLSGLNDSMNTIINEIIDAGSLANIVAGFVAKRSGVKKGDLKFRMGEFVEVDTYIDDIKKAIYTFDFKGPNNTLYATLGLLYEYAKMVSSISETMTGQMPASDTPATTIMALIEEGRKVYSAIYKRHHTSFSSELRKIYTLNSIFLSEMEYFKVLGDKGVPMGPKEMVGRSDFIGEYDVIPVSDPNIMSRAEKILKAQQLVADVRANPITAQNEEANFEATKRYYEALGIDNIDEVLKRPGPPPDINPIDENGSMLLEQQATVLPEQDHPKHIEVHTAFLESPLYAEQISPNAKNIIERHIKEHVAAFYVKGAKGGA